MEQTMNQKAAFAAIRAENMTVRREIAGEYRVNFVRGSEMSAYYTADLQDAVATAPPHARRVPRAGRGLTDHVPVSRHHPPAGADLRRAAGRGLPVDRPPDARRADGRGLPARGRQGLPVHRQVPRPRRGDRIGERPWTSSSRPTAS